MINEPRLLSRDYNRDPNVKALPQSLSKDSSHVKLGAWSATPINLSPDNSMKSKAQSMLSWTQMPGICHVLVGASIVKHCFGLEISGF